MTDKDEQIAPVEIGELKDISIKGAREHNLKNVSLSIPRDKFIVITGLSGSGKSTLAFDTLYAEGQRRYVECLSSYARQFLGMMRKPEVDSIEGLSPAISIEQKTISHNPRSTVGTVTEIYDYLRLLFAKVGKQYCVDCKIPVQQKSLDQIVDEMLEKYNSLKVQILAPLVKGRKGHYKELFDQLLKSGFTKARIDGIIKGIEPDMQLSRYQVHNIELVVDRCFISAEHEHRISESVGLALQKGEGTMMLLIDHGDSGLEEKLFSTSYTCPGCGRAYEQLAPNMFSFNSPYGACSKCEGLGEIKDFDLKLVIPNKALSVMDGAISPIGKQHSTWIWTQVEAFASKFGIDLRIPIGELDDETVNMLLFGTKDSEIPVAYTFSGGGDVTYKHKFLGILPSLRHQYENSPNIAFKRNIESHMSNHTCENCHGGRLKPENLAVYVHDLNIQDIAKRDITDLRKLFTDLEEQLTEREHLIAGVIIKEINARLGFLENVGLSYLNLDRSVRTLSGGEAQRIRLASQIGSQLVGIMYILDEPSIGLHQHDNNKLINSLKELRDLGNTVIVVEHDKAMIQESDIFVDIGPGAGVHGGEIILCSAPDNLSKLDKDNIENSLTALYLLNKRTISYNPERRNGRSENIILHGASGNNLKKVDLKIPLGRLVCITGLSGSGKSSLINDTLYPIISNHFYDSSLKPLDYDSVEGLELIDKIIEIDQSPIGRTPRSNPATYSGLFTLIRDFFALLPDARIRGYKAGRFSFNVKGGRCETCEGAGIRKIEMNFLPEVYIKCEECDGKRYNPETLNVKYKDKSIADVLEMTVEEAIGFFSEIPKIKSKLQTIFDVGLGYIKLGQQAPTLSGGEAQRVKLATELSKTSTGKTLYLLDEPTTGLHFEDIRILLNLLNKLVDKGNTVVIIEHNLDVIKCADWIIDLGPEGGMNGGKIIAEGTPEALIKNKKSYTGKYLKHELLSVKAAIS